MASSADARRLIERVSADPVFMRRLRHVRSLGLRDWCLGAGALRNLVWDALHDQAASSLADVDVAFFDGADVSRERDRSLEARLQRLDPSTPWDVVNQAGVHHWLERE